MNIQEIRQQYPQYNDLSDQQLADSMYKKYYSDIPQDQFYQKIGFAPQAPGQNVPRETKPNQEFIPGMDTLAKHVAAGGLTIARDTLNVPGSFGIPFVPKDIGKDIDFYKSLGIEEGVPDVLGREAAQFLPFFKGAQTLRGLSGLTKGTALVDNALAGAGYGLAFGPEGEKIKSAITGAATGLGAGALGRGVEKFVTKPLTEWYGRSIIPGLVEKAQGLLKESYLPNIKKNAANWTVARAAATGADKELSQTGSVLNASSYDQFIDKFIQQVGKYTPAKQAAYKDALEFAEQARQYRPTNFEDVIEVNQNLNTYLKDYFKGKGLDKADHNSKEFLKGLKNTLSNDVLNANSKLISPEAFNSFKESWAAANQSHPKALASNYLRDLFEHGNTAKKLPTLYGKLPEAQRKSFFGGEPAEPYLEAVNKGLLEFGKPSSRNDGLHAIGRHLIGFGVPGALGFGAGLSMGLPWEEAAELGAASGAGYEGLRAGLGKFATPGMLEKAIARSQTSNPNAGNLINFLLQTQALPALPALGARQ